MTNMTNSVQKINLFQIPALASLNETSKNGKNTKPPVFVSVIDASGSMHRFWPGLAKGLNEFLPKENCITITFDNETHFCDSNVLSERIYDHGGGMTNIPKAFLRMEKELDERFPDKDIPATVLFVSDGQDNYLHTLEKRLKDLKGNCGRRITFLCLGIEKNFPTFLSMWLREHYHNTESSIPALYLIEHWSDQAVLNKLEAMKGFFAAREKVAVSSVNGEELCALPWEAINGKSLKSDKKSTEDEFAPASPSSTVDSSEEDANSTKPKISMGLITGSLAKNSNCKSIEVFEGSWIATTASEILINNRNKITTTTNSNANKYFDAMLEVFRGYAQELNMLSLQNSKHLKNHADKTLKFMKRVILSYTEYFAPKDPDTGKAFDVTVEIEDRHSKKVHEFVLSTKSILDRAMKSNKFVELKKRVQI